MIAPVAAIQTGCEGIDPDCSTIAPTGNKAIRSTSLGAYQSLIAGVSFVHSVVQLTNPGDSVPAATFKGDHYLDDLNLYERLKPTSTGFDLVYSTNPTFSTQAGTVAVRSSVGKLAYSTYPVTITTDVNVAGGNMPCQGRIKTTYTDAKGSNKVEGTLTLPGNGEVLTLNFTRSADQVVAGTALLTQNGTTLNIQLSGRQYEDLKLAFTTKPQGYNGSGSVNFEKKTLNLAFVTPQRATASFGAADGLTITYPNGINESVQSPTTANLLHRKRGRKFWTAMRESSHRYDIECRDR